MKIELTKEEFLKKSNAAHKFFCECIKNEDPYIYTALEFWNIIQLEKKICPLIKELKWTCERKQIEGIGIVGFIKKGKKEVGVYNNSPWPTIMLYPFFKGRGEVADGLIEQGAVKPIKTVHRILDWHDLIKDGYVQKLAKNQWVIHFVPEIPKQEELDKIINDLKTIK